MCVSEEHDRPETPIDLEIRKWTMRTNTYYLDDKFRGSDIVKGMKFDMGVESKFFGIKKVYEVHSVTRVR